MGNKLKILNRCVNFNRTGWRCSGQEGYSCFDCLCFFPITFSPQEQEEEKKVKTLRVQLPISVWEAFSKLFPEVGERTMVLRRVIGILLELGEEKDCFFRLLKEEFKHRVCKD